MRWKSGAEKLELCYDNGNGRGGKDCQIQPGRSGYLYLEIGPSTFTGT